VLPQHDSLAQTGGAPVPAGWPQVSTADRAAGTEDDLAESPCPQVTLHVVPGGGA
jgi:hypothetical protein